MITTKIQTFMLLTLRMFTDRRIALFSTTNQQNQNSIEPSPKFISPPVFHHLYFNQELLEYIKMQKRCKEVLLEIQNEQNFEQLVKKLQKHAKEYSTKTLDQDNFKGQTSRWQIQNMFERQILWQLRYSAKDKKSYSKLIKRYLEGYRPYVEGVIKSIFSQYKTFNSMNQVKQGKLPKFSYQKISDNLKVVRQAQINRKLIEKQKNDSNNCKKKDQKNQQEKNKQKDQKEKIQKFQNYYCQIFQALCDPYKEPYWENRLSIQQYRFTYTAESEGQYGITFIPSVYECKILQRMFDRYQSQNIKQQFKQFRYLMGLKYNGKSHAQIMGRLLSSYLYDYKVLAFSNLQRGSINQIINLFCGTITRDLWYHLTPDMMKKLNTIWKQNNSKQELGQDASYSQIRNDMKALTYNISQLFRKNQTYQKPKDFNAQCQQKIKTIYKENRKQINHLYGLIDIIKQIQPHVIVIDQFNFFGRTMYEIFKKKDPSTQNIFNAGYQLLLARILIFLPYPIRMFASINNYPYFQLMKALIKNNMSRDDHQTNPQILTELFQGKERTKSVFTFLQILQAQKQRNQKSSIVKNLIHSTFFVQLFQNELNYALNQRQCSQLAKQIYNNFYNNQKINFVQKLKFQTSENKFEIQGINLEESLLEHVILPAVKNIQNIIFNELTDQILKFVEQNKFSEEEASKYISLFPSINAHDSKIQSAVRSIYSNKFLSNIGQQKKGFYQIMKSFNTSHQGYSKLLVKMSSSTQFRLALTRLLFQQQKIQQKDLLSFHIKHRKRYVSLLQKKELYQQLIPYLDQGTYLGSQFERRIYDYLSDLSKISDNKQKKIKYSILQGDHKSNLYFSFQQVKILQSLSGNNKSFLPNVKLKEILKQKTLYVVRAQEGALGVDFYLMFLKDTKKHVIALETGINKLSKNGFDQYNNYEEVHQEAIKELKKQCIFLHMIVTLEPKEEDEIFKIGFNNIVYNFAERFFEPSDSQITQLRQYSAWCKQKKLQAKQKKRSQNSKN